MAVRLHGGLGACRVEPRIPMRADGLSWWFNAPSLDRDHSLRPPVVRARPAPSPGLAAALT
jgi:hypothetical protein